MESSQRSWRHMASLGSKELTYNGLLWAMLTVMSFEVGTSYSAQSVPYMEGNALSAVAKILQTSVVCVYSSGWTRPLYSLHIDDWCTYTLLVQTYTPYRKQLDKRSRNHVLKCTHRWLEVHMRILYQFNPYTHYRKQLKEAETMY